MQRIHVLLICVLVVFGAASNWQKLHGAAAASADAQNTADANPVKSKSGSATDDEVVRREEEAIKIDGLNVAQIRELQEKSEKFTFQAEVDRMMKLIINSLYKNKEIFLRELISNASDALDKIRLMSLTDPRALAATDKLEVRIRADKPSRTLRIIDTGVGMTREDLVNNLGTIAKSGTNEFLNRLTESTSTTEMNNLIGQFGVGFYSSFLVADTVTVISKHNDDEQHIWESKGSQFNVIKDPRGNTLKRGTEIILSLKDEAVQYLEIEELRELAKKYSEFINFPIYLWSLTGKKVEEPATDDKAKDEQKSSAAADDATVEEEKDKPAKKKKMIDEWDWVLINKNKPIWQRKPTEIMDSEYNDFYKSFSKDSEAPLAKTHFSVEGEVTFKSIIFVAQTAQDAMLKKMSERSQNLKLYVKRVFITSDNLELVPRYLGFVRGIVDSDDLPLNVSRETLQQHKLLKVIRKKMVRKIIDMLSKLDSKTYATFWKEYSTNIKLGIYEDQSNKVKLMKLLRFRTTTKVRPEDDNMTSLMDYVSRMKPEQKAIYFLTGSDVKKMMNSPFIERALHLKYEVLLLTEPVDEYCVQVMKEFDGKPLRSLARVEVDMPLVPELERRAQAWQNSSEKFTTWVMLDALENQVNRVTVNERLVKSPAVIVADVYGWTGNQQRLMRNQAYKKTDDAITESYSALRGAFELNYRHPFIKRLQQMWEKDPKDKKAKELTQLLYQTTVLRSDYELKDSDLFGERVSRMLQASFDISLDRDLDAEMKKDMETQEKEASQATAEKPDDKAADSSKKQEL